ncbi:tyrosine-type recombinase/integrase [Campylobacter sp. RM16192]|uniref:tyrosine-type recombinase/integrase n=1 Tax=Campylobacter sp. RM16192 TaxID=1660080 RepID=UPI00145119A1|nr:site-specific integrase [Campylobacter sp. RM16192]QCD52524.1 site-specific recombinase, phage integrase family [Campylobacter sp. RM16192]
MKLSQISSSYIRELERTDYAYVGEIKCLYKHTNKLPGDIEKITQADIVAWIEHMRSYLAPQTIKKIVLAWRRACEFAIEKGILDKNPFLKAKYPKVHIPRTSPFTKEEVTKLLECSSGSMQAFLAVAFYTGARTCEILALEWSDIDFEKKTISITKSLSRGIVKNRTKTEVDREIPLFDEILPYLDQIDKGTRWIFSYNRDHLFGSYSLYRPWKRLCKECGVEYRSLRHTRHTFATHMVEKAVRGEIPIKWVSQILGHSLEMTLKVYARFIKDEHLGIERGMNIF